VLIDGRRHIGGFAVGERVVTAHDSLKLGEFADHG
jgi:hypothetical protein